MKKIPIGISDFRKLINEDCYYIDQSSIIEELIDTGAEAILFPRPRRFGKTLTMSMLKYYFDIEEKNENKNLFDGLYISTNKDLCNKYQGSMPVVSVSFKDLKASNIESFYNKVRNLIINLYNEHTYIYDSLNNSQRLAFDSIVNETANMDKYQSAIASLITYLYNYYNSEEYKASKNEKTDDEKKANEIKVLLLIDEYDVPIQEAYFKTENLDDQNSFYAQVIDFIRGVFSTSAKDNGDKLFKAIFTGVLRVSQESIFSDLNNFEVYGLLNSPFNEHFGFTEEKTKELLEYYDLELTKEVKDMYDGYKFNGVNVYNPWSILKYASWKKFEPFWVNTSSNGLIKEMITTATSNVKGIIEKLIQGESTIFVYDEMLTYKNLRNNNDLNSILNMLFASGYLTYDKTELINNVVRTYIKVPNREVNILLTKIMEETVNPSRNEMFAYDMLDSIVDYDLVKMENTLNDNLYSLSYMDNKEFMYHLYTLGFLSCCLNNDDYIVKSNRETGLGRSDVMIERVDKSFGYVFEFKVTDDEDMESVAKDALNQINTKEYYKELELAKIKDIRKVSIVFNNKKCIVR